jgi:transposase
VADPIGYKSALRFAGHHASGRRVWAIEFTRPASGRSPAAQRHCSWSHPGRLRSDGAFATPIPPPPADDPAPRQPRRRSPAHGALHHRPRAPQARPAIRADAARREAEGKTAREIKRWLKRCVARESSER